MASGFCSVVSGAAKCSCAPGFTLNADAKSCTDNNECANGTANCAAGSQICATAKDGADLARGWFHDSSAWPQIALWGGLLVLISLGGWWVNRRTRRRWLGWVLAAAPFVVTLYFFFQNVNRLLPPGL